MRLGSAVVLSYLDAGSQPRCGRKDFWGACCLLLLKRVAHPWTLKGGVKPRQGKPSLVIRSRLELGPSWVLVLRNAWEITIEERPLALEMCLHGYGGCREMRLENGSFSPQNAQLRGTTAWYTPY